MNIGPGIYPNMPEKQYRSAFGLNKSNMSDLLRSPAHYKSTLKNPGKPTHPKIIGSAFHLRLLEPGRFETEVHEHKNAYAKQTEEGIFINKNQFLDIENMMESINSHKITKELFKDGMSEVSIFWNDFEHGFIGKGRIDYYRPDIDLIVDLKTCDDASFDKFNETAYKFKYHWQKRWYLEGINALTEKIFDFIFVAIEKEEPYGINVYTKFGAFLEQDAIYNINRCKQIYSNCLKSDNWPVYEEQEYDLLGPKWAIKMGDSIYE